VLVQGRASARLDRADDGHDLGFVGLRELDRVVVAGLAGLDDGLCLESGRKGVIHRTGCVLCANRRGIKRRRGCCDDYG
jgi:hypothetical protein